MRLHSRILPRKKVTTTASTHTINTPNNAVLPSTPSSNSHEAPVLSRYPHNNSLLQVSSPPTSSIRTSPRIITTPPSSHSTHHSLNTSGRSIASDDTASSTISTPSSSSLKNNETIKLQIPLYKLWFMNLSIFSQLSGIIFTILLYLQLQFPSYYQYINQFQQSCDSNFFLHYNDQNGYCQVTFFGFILLSMHLFFEIIFVAFFSYLYSIHIHDNDDYDFIIPFTHSSTITATTTANTDTTENNNTSDSINKHIARSLICLTGGSILYTNSFLRSLFGLINPDELRTIQYREKLSLYSGLNLIEKNISPNTMNYWNRVNLLNFFTENCLEAIIVCILFYSHFISIYSILFSLPMLFNTLYRLIMFVFQYFYLIFFSDVIIIVNMNNTKNSQSTIINNSNTTSSSTDNTHAAYMNV